MSDVEKLESIAGYERKFSYKRNDIRKIVERDICLVNEEKIHKPYLEFVDKNEKMLFEFSMNDGVRVRVGEIGAFTTNEMALWLNEQVQMYVLAGTMGKGYPRNDSEINKKLFASMLGGYDKSRIIINFDKFDSKNGVWVPISGVSEYYGKDNLSIVHALENNNDSISSLAALNIDRKNGLLAYEHFVSRWGNVELTDVVGMSRLWRRESEVLKKMDVNDKEMAWENMALLSMAVAKQYQNGDRQKLPELFIYDTLPPIQERLARIFKMEEIVDAKHLSPTDTVMNSVLRYHYGPESIGGYEGQIIMGVATLGEYLVNSWQYLRTRGIDMLKLLYDRDK